MRVREFENDHYQAWQLVNMTELCAQVPADKVWNPLPTSFAAHLFEVSILLWGLLRVIHDSLLVEEYSQTTTLMVSFWSAVTLTVAAASATFMAWSATEPLVAPLRIVDHGVLNRTADFSSERGVHQCGCFFRFDALATTGVIGVPLSLTAHAFAKWDDLYRALVCGDYMITKKYHISIRLVEGNGIKPDGTVLGTSGLGKPEKTKIEKMRSLPDAHLAEAKSCFFMNLKLVGFSMRFVLLLAWALPLPMLFLRALQLAAGRAPLLLTPVLTCCGFIPIVLCCLSCFNVSGARKVMEKVSKADHLEVLTTYKGAGVQEALVACPELRFPSRLLELAAVQPAEYGAPEVVRRSLALLPSTPRSARLSEPLLDGEGS